jgi:potassium intermediate/small conductance calcium-activated channel subfamily N protein 2
VQATGFTELQITLNTDEINLVKTILQVLSMISTGFLYILIFIRYKMRLKWLIAKRFVPKKATLFSTGSINYLILEWILISLLPTPFYSSISFKNYNDQEAVETTYHVNDLMSLLILLRVFGVFRIFLSNSRYYTNVAHRICSLTGCESGSNYIYVIKCIMKNSPLEILLASMVIYIITFAYAVKVCERPLIFAIIQKNLGDPSFTLPVANDVSNYYNAMWLMIVTMATIGYGDYYPRTLPGRAITFFSCICGVVTVSLLTITLQNLMEMSNAESRSYNIVEKLVLKKRKQKHAAYILTNLTKLGFWGGVVNKDITEEQKNYHIQQIKKHLNKFRSLRKFTFSFFFFNIL